MSKKFNLDEKIKESTLVNIGDPCPFCKGDKPFMNISGNDFVRHIVDTHKPQFAKIIGKVENE